MARLIISTSEHATPGYVVATLRGATPAIVWRGPAKDLGQARGYDTLHAHPVTAAAIREIAERKNIEVREVA